MNATPQLLNLATNESGFAFDSVSGASYQFSELALEIIGWIKNGLDADQIRNRIVEAYDVAEHTADRDLTAYIANLRAAGLVEG
jgi:hypothetical protein